MNELLDNLLMAEWQTQFRSKERSVADPVCGNCVHWHRHQTNPADLSQVFGDCRAVPPSAQIIPSGQVISMYPQLPPQFSACHLLSLRPVTQSRLQLSVENGA